MPYSSYPYGSPPYGGLAPEALDIQTQALSLTLHVPVWIVKHSEPATFALGLTIQTPTAVTSDVVSTLALTLTQHAPVPFVGVFPSNLSMLLSQQPEITVVGGQAPLQTLTLSLVPEGIEILKDPATFALGLTLHQAGTNVGYAFIGVPAPFLLNLSSPGVPYGNTLRVRIVRYIKDPVVNGGCAQCGTFLYKQVRGKQVRGESITIGRNFDKDNLREDNYIRCGRCGFINHPQRNTEQPEGSRTGWGIRYDPLEVVPNEPLDQATFNGQPDYPGTVGN
jgi:hypothetical protein